jgi:hypothetical protein
VQVTRNGGREAFEPPGGEFVYYTKTPPILGIWRISLRTGAEIRFIDAGTQGRWAISSSGIYFLNGPDDLEFQDFSATPRIRIRTPGLQLGHGVPNMIGAAPNDCCILISALVRAEEQLLLVQNFQ